MKHIVDELDGTVAGYCLIRPAVLVNDFMRQVEGTPNTIYDQHGEEVGTIETHHDYSGDEQITLSNHTSDGSPQQFQYITETEQTGSETGSKQEMERTVD